MKLRQVGHDELTLGLLFYLEDGDDILLRNKRWTLSELLGVITQRDRGLKHRNTFVLKQEFTKMMGYHLKAIPVTGREGPLSCETSRLPHFV
jgi:hypothetical protein